MGSVQFCRASSPVASPVQKTQRVIFSQHIKASCSTAEIYFKLHYPHAKSGRNLEKLLKES